MILSPCERRETGNFRRAGHNLPMPRHHEQRRLPYSADQMYDLVADVGRYGEFLPWVSGVRVRSDSDHVMVADLIVGFKGLRERFTSRVNKVKPRRIHVDYLDGPLKHLHNAWEFHATDDGCLVDFTVDFAFRNSLFERLAGQVFERALRRMISAFEDRAAQLYAIGVSGASRPGSSNSNATSAA